MTRRLAAVPDQPRRAIALIRVSSSNGRGDDLTSPALQRQAIDGYAAAKGMTVVEWVEAVDESGSNGKSLWWRRLDRAVERIEAGDVEALLVWKFSRAARNRRRWAIALDRVEVAGGVLESATEQLDTSTSTGRLARGMLAELAAWESEVRGEGWKETHARRAREGLPHSNQPRLGYTVDRDGYQPDPVESPLLREAFDRYLRGESHVTIHRWLTDLGITSKKSGRAWTVRGIIQAMDSGFAAGHLHHGGDRGRPHTWDPGAQPPLITADTWDRYQRARRARGADTRQARRASAPSHALTGIVRCSACGYVMACRKPSPSVLSSLTGANGSHARAGEPYLFSCYNQACPDRHHATVAKVGEAFRAFLVEHANDLEISGAAVAANQSARVAAAAERLHLERERDRVARDLVNAMRRHSSKIYDTKSYLVLRDELLAAERAVTEQLDQLAAALDRPAPSSKLFRDLLTGWNRMDMTGRREAINDLDVQVRVFRKDGLRGNYSALVRCKGGWDQTPW